MLKHIVMWKLKDNAEGKTKEENAKRIKNMIERLQGIIPELLKAEIGFNVSKSDRAFDIVLYSEFENEDTLDVYRKHPEHQKVVDFLSKVNTEVCAVDYYI